jgi:two-component system, OmpR family, sensor kinase
MMRTPSLQRQAMRAALVAFVVVSVAVASFVYLNMRAQLEDDLAELLQTRRSVAEQVLVEVRGDLPVTARRLAELGVPARVTMPDGRDVSVPPPSSAATVDAVEALRDPGAAVSLIRTADDGRIEVLASRDGIDRILTRLLLMLGAGFLVSFSLALQLLRRAVALALRPLGLMSDAARRIAAGAREERLRPDDPSTELGSLAHDFDEMLDALEGALVAARTAEHSQRRFLADVAHQLRTPMAGIRVSTELLLLDADATPEERDRLLGNLVRETTRVTRMVNGLLRISRLDLDAGLLLQSTDLVELCEREVARQAELAEVPVVLTVVEAPAAPVLIDPEQFQEALANLLDNARRFAHRRIGVDVTELDDGQVVVRVSDDGPGLAAEDVDRAFERFVTFGSGTGTGLGLPIARGIARAHGGELSYIGPGTDGGYVLRLPGGAGLSDGTRPTGAAPVLP